jgi:hypothetical protein
MNPSDAPDPAAALRPIAVKRLSAASWQDGARAAAQGRDNSLSAPILRLRSAAGHLEVLVEAREMRDLPALRIQAGHGQMRLLIGDESELEHFDVSQCYANLLQFNVDLRLGRIECSTSVVGLPPLFVIESSRGSAIAAPLRPDAGHGLPLEGLDLEAAADVLRWGHPIDGRTLAQNLRLAPVSAVVVLRDAGVAIVRAASAGWDSSQAPRDIASIIEEQMVVFARAAKRLDGRAAFMSLSGGLDSRTVAAATALGGRRIPCVTLALDHRSLDAKLAAAFCKTYALEHRIISTDAEFQRGLADRVVKSAGLTLGVSALAQSVDLFLYEQMGSGFRARISGNLGNQVGRGGVESLTASMQPNHLFSPQLQRALHERPTEPWYLKRMHSRGFAQALFTEEVNYWSIPNYVLGSAHAVQLTPYADRRLIQLAAELFANLQELRSPTVQSIRRRDLRHRLAGPPLEQSFQRSFLCNYDELGAKIAINWGWLARGGWSPSWLLAALPTVASAGLSKTAPVLNRLWRALPPVALADWPRLLREDLRDLTHDCLQSDAVRSSSLFDNSQITRLLQRHFSGAEPCFGTIARLLEVGMGCLIVARQA